MPKYRCASLYHPFSPAETEIIDAEMSKLLSKGMFVNTPDHVSGTFSRTKKNGNYRMILNLKTFNGFFKFKSVEDALDLIIEGCYFGSVELKDPSYTILIQKKYQEYLKLFRKEEYYQYIFRTNGFSQTLRVFTNVLTPPFKYLKSKGHLSVKYIDHSLFLGDTFEIFSRLLVLQLQSYGN